MQARAKVTSKGQITIPRDVREFLRVGPGDSVVFESDDEGMRVRPASRDSVFEKYRGAGPRGIPSGRAGVIKYIRELRGHIDDV